MTAADLPPSSLSDRVDRVRTRLRRAVLRRRRLLAALLTGVAVVAGLAATTTPPPAAVAVTVAARDLPAGAVLGPDDVHSVDFAPGSVPSSVVAQPAGRTLAGPLVAGEPVTASRLVGPGLVDGATGLQAVPVRLPDAAAVGLLEVGDEIDLVAADPQAGTAKTVVGGARVLAVPSGVEPSDADGLPGRLVVVGVDAVEVTELMAAAGRSLLTYAWTTH